MSSAKKSVLLGAALILLAGGGWLFFQRDSLAAEGIRKYGTAILGVKVKVSRVKIDVTNQSAEVRGLVIENPPGFSSRRFLSLDSVTLSLDVSTLASSVVLVRELVLVKPEVTYEKQNGRSNLEVLQGNVDQYISDTEKAFGLQATKNDKYMNQSSKKWIITHFYMKDGSATVGPGIRVRIPNIHIRDIGKRTNGASTADATKQVLSALTLNVTGAAASVINSAANGVGEGVKKGVSGVGKKLKSLFGR